MPAMQPQGAQVTSSIAASPPAITFPPTKPPPVFSPIPLPVFVQPPIFQVTSPIFAIPPVFPPTNPPPVMSPPTLPVFMQPPVFIFTPPPFVAPVFYTPPPFVPPPMVPVAPPALATAPAFIPPVIPSAAPPRPQQPWIPGFPFAAPVTTTKAAKTAPTTEFAYVDIDSLIEESESESTQKPTDDMNAFGGLDIGGMVGGFLGGFASSASADQPTRVSSGIE